MSEETELHLKYRPKNLKRVFGQKEAIKGLAALFKDGKLPHAILLYGPSGVGKTTIGRIIRTMLDCDDVDFKEVNCADERGVDDIRGMKASMQYAAMSSSSGRRVWLLDEAAVLAPIAQKALLKVLEECPRHCYLLLATTDPDKLLPTIVSRCHQVGLTSLPEQEMYSLLDYVCDREGKTISKEVKEQIVLNSEGSAREALVLLHQVLSLTTEEDRLNSVSRVSLREKSIHIARELFKPDPDWKTVAARLKELDEDPEKVRWQILGYAASILLNQAGTKSKVAQRAACIIHLFDTNFYDTKKAGLVVACFDACK